MLEEKLELILKKLGMIEVRQDEMYQVVRALEENVNVVRAEQEKMVFALANIQGKVSKLADNVEDHETVINQIRSIK